MLDALCERSQRKARFYLKNGPKCDIISKGSLLRVVKIHAVG
jgi:hypothetical protein